MRNTPQSGLHGFLQSVTMDSHDVNDATHPTARGRAPSLFLTIDGPPTTPHPPLRKHQPGQESDGQTGSWCLDKAVLAQGGGGGLRAIGDSPVLNIASRQTEGTA